MKITVLLALSVAALSAQAATDFGGFSMHSSVPKDQVSLLINDLKFLYQNPTTTADSEFLKIAAMEKGDGPAFHNWLLNRAKYIIGENFEMSEANMAIRNFRFPSTPIPKLPSAPIRPTEPTPAPTSGGPVTPAPQKVVVMSNMGAALYTVGKTQGVGIGVKFDGREVIATSPRVGIFQVGRGLFLERFMLNKVNPLAAANSIFRLGTLAHESRHSDGNGLTTGLMHAFCPKGHSFEGYAACDTSSNGPYTIGALAERHLVNNCTTCSAEEKSGIMAGVADSFGRVINGSSTARQMDLTKLIEQNEMLLSTYETLVSLSINKELVVKYQSEIKRLQALIASYQFEFDSIDMMPVAPPMVDVTPEGSFTTISLKESMKLMQNSLR